MAIQWVHAPRPPRGERVIALHCSGGGAGQWCTLAETLGGGYEVAAPEHYGCESTGHWSGEHAFALADEAARTLALIDEAGAKVHLVGHSYGGGVALNVALARPERIASMALYEPTAFHLLRQLGEPGAAAQVEIVGVIRRICEGVITGDLRAAMTVFIDYWSGPGAWSRLRPTVQAALIRWAPKAPLDFYALMAETAGLEAYRALPFPVLILRGERAPVPTRLIAEGLARQLPAVRLVVLDRAGHMGPVTHASEVGGEIARHIAGADAAWGRRPHDLAGNRAAEQQPAMAAS
jgi:pimeloyl-ACP methyl ester carboxylesterase